MSEAIHAEVEYEDGKKVVVIRRFPEQVYFSRQFLEEADREYVTALDGLIQIRADRGGHATYAVTEETPTRVTAERVQG